MNICIYDYFYEKKDLCNVDDFWHSFSYLTMDRKKHEINLIANDNIKDCPPQDLWTLFTSLASHYHIFLAEIISIKDKNSYLREISICKCKNLDIRFITNIKILNMNMTIEFTREQNVPDTIKKDNLSQKQKSARPVNVKSSKPRTKKVRRCNLCGVDISDRPSYHFLCYSCWELSNKNIESDEKNCKRDEIIYEKPEKHSLRDALECDEWAYYNLYGEFPTDDDW